MLSLDGNFNRIDGLQLQIFVTLLGAFCCFARGDVMNKDYSLLCNQFVARTPPNHS